IEKGIGTWLQQRTYSVTHASVKNEN
ncbi:cobalamin-independent synthase, N-terminal domain protein, partial [Vibrio parahaemolyticus V-223/04]